jgi:hypothetical protein
MTPVKLEFKDHSFSMSYVIFKRDYFKVDDPIILSSSFKMVFIINNDLIELMCNPISKFEGVIKSFSIKGLS